MNAVVPIQYVGQPIKRREDFKLLTGKAGVMSTTSSCRACCTWSW